MDAPLGNSVDPKWEKEYHDKIFNAMTEVLTNRRKEDPEFTIEILEQMLDTIYINQGSSWGKSTVVEIKENATAVAFEVFHANWLEEIKKEKEAKEAAEKKEAEGEEKKN